MATKTTGNAGVQPSSQQSPMEDPLQLLFRSLTKLYSLWVSLTYPFASKGHKLSVHYPCDLLRSRAHRIKLGNSVQILKDAIIDVLAPPEQNGEPIIVVDDHAQIGYRCLLSAKNCIYIAGDLVLGLNCVVAAKSVVT
jgi:hypothetical protein